MLSAFQVSLEQQWPVVVLHEAQEFSNNESHISECDYWQNGIQLEETRAASGSRVA